MKRRRLRNIISKGRADMVFIQETKTMKMTDCFVSSLWGKKDVKWTAKDLVCALGGIITLWKSNFISLLFSVST